MENKIEKVMIEFTAQEKNDFMLILDEYTRSKGINGAHASLYFAMKIDKAFAPEKIEEKQE